MNGWIKINEHRLFIRRITGYQVRKGLSLLENHLRIYYFDGINTVSVDILHHYEHHTKRLDALFNIERSPDAKVSKTDARPTAAISRR